MVVTILSSIGCVLTASILIPQLIKTIKTKSTGDLSVGTLLIYAIAPIFWIIATALSFKTNPMAIPLICVNGISLVSSLILLVLKLHSLAIKNEEIIMRNSKNDKRNR